MQCDRDEEIHKRLMEIVLVCVEVAVKRRRRKKEHKREAD